MEIGERKEYVITRNHHSAATVRWELGGEKQTQKNAGVVLLASTARS
jgi:hypothetical protein